jgi:hypothetical protein
MADWGNVTYAISSQTIGAAFALAALAVLPSCGGYEAGVEYPDVSVDFDVYVHAPEGEPGAGIGFNHFKVGPQACKNFDTHTVTQKLGQDDFTRFLEQQGIKGFKIKKARSNLYWYDLPNGGGGPNDFIRLRLAVLDTQPLASADLHQSLLEHGPGWWGVRRSNLAILAPKTSLREAMAFAIKYKLICWGMFTYAGLDDAYVVTGPYGEI